MIPAPAELALLSDEDLDARYATSLRELGLDPSDPDRIRRVLDEEPAELIEEWSRIQVEYPLADARLWVRDDAPWDQRRLVCSLVHPLSLVLGGNRAGKTYAILEALVAFALGRDHPSVAAWIEDNDLDPSMFPIGPGECYAVAGSASQSIKIHRKDIARLLPANAHWRSMNAPTEASVEIPVPGYATPAIIWFKSVDQGHRGFKGDQVRFVAISEEPEGEEGRLVLDECMRATSSTGGRVVLEMTPQNGMTWVYDDLVEGPIGPDGEHHPRFDCRLVVLDTSHNRMVEDYDSVQRWLASMSDEERLMRQHGQFVDRRGLVYTSWSRGDGSRDGLGHLVDDFEIPREWPRFRVGDWGQTRKNGTAVLWGALAPDGTLFLYREYYLANEPSYVVHASNVRDLEPVGEGVLDSWADHDPEAIDAFADQGLRFENADKVRVEGISRCADRLRIVGNRPRLKVFRSLRRFLFEIENYRRDPNKRDGAPIKKDDHVMDCWRYMENGIADWEDSRSSSDALMRGMAGLLQRYGR